MKIRRWIVAGLLFAILWVFIRGASITATSLLANFLVGVAVGLPVAYVFRRLYGEEIRLNQSLLVALPYTVLYILAFFKQVLVANVDVAYRVLVPGATLEPQVILVPLRVESELGVTTIANSITITPGTVTIDYEPDENALYVHAIDGREPEALVEPVRQWENYALVIFNERLAPEDPPPEITIHPPGHPLRSRDAPELPDGFELSGPETPEETDDE
ncbi:Na+/H+ antiporter subunit E [Natronomonas sp. LN261]|uniref:Na+/H+ antiporter subunit E n=1 Tax=Natronomonas sp. LN261 TaxID=2750669 RepID=UPI0015EE8A91|nr:Na+/H+ antiporter subunit E [Natronomonas sp. LN261]